jgi:hypothetical protein
MKRLLPPLLLASLSLVSFTSPALADVKLRLAVSPSSIAQCSQGHLFVAVGNTGTHPILVRVCFALDKAGTGTVFGPFCGRLALAAGEQRQHEFTFVIPPQVPIGDYAFVARATASDGTTDQATAPFSVTAGSCVPGTQPAVGDQLNGALQSIGATPEGATPTSESTWGRIKILYR